MGCLLSDLVKSTEETHCMALETFIGRHTLGDMLKRQFSSCDIPAFPKKFFGGMGGGGTIFFSYIWFEYTSLRTVPAA